jgi:hypothetical protein
MHNSEQYPGLTHLAFSWQQACICNVIIIAFLRLVTLLLASWRFSTCIAPLSFAISSFCRNEKLRALSHVAGCFRQ